MNLIEQLGGYERAKNHRDYLIDFGNEFNRPNKYEVNKINNALLEYRRQHNIFEAGDIAVNSRGDESRLLKIWRVDMCAHNSKMSIADYDAESLGGWSRFHALRHATDEEIKAGRRLPVIESDDCSDIRNHISPNTVVIDHAT